MLYRDCAVGKSEVLCNGETVQYRDCAVGKSEAVLGNGETVLGFAQSRHIQLRCRATTKGPEKIVQYTYYFTVVQFPCALSHFCDFHKFVQKQQQQPTPKLKSSTSQGSLVETSATLLGTSALLVVTIKLLGTSALLVVTSALLLVTMFATRNNAFLHSHFFSTCPTAHPQKNGTCVAPSSEHCYY